MSTAIWITEFICYLMVIESQSRKTLDRTKPSARTISRLKNPEQIVIYLCMDKSSQRIPTTSVPVLNCSIKRVFFSNIRLVSQNQLFHVLHSGTLKNLTFFCVIVFLVLEVFSSCLPSVSLHMIL